MIRTCIESPFRPKTPCAADGLQAVAYAQELARNIAYAWDLVRDSLRRGEAPFASHLFYPNVLASGDDRDPVERQLGIDAGTAWAEAADLIVIGEDLGITEGMMQRIDELYVRREQLRGRSGDAHSLRIEYRSLPQWAGKHA